MSTNTKLPKNIYKPANTKFYWLRVKINGQTHRESLRTTSLRVAEKRAKSRVGELRGKEEAGELEWKFSAGWVKFYEKLDQEGSGWSAETRKRYQTSLRQILRVLDHIFTDLDRDISSVSASEVSVSIVSEFVARRQDERVAVGTINRDLTAFGQLMKAIKNDGWIKENPVRVFERQGMKEVLPDIVIPTDEAIAKLSARAPGTLAHFPGFLCATGGRVTEMARLQWRDIAGLEKPVEGNVLATLRFTKGGESSNHRAHTGGD
ncbi:hypothetical protein SAMN05421759_1071 [Roseivivax lentus]|uniref:Core-binding (CB) domain-containing protein n=1 Tax=Roseivivax lentus TaxID=633194 RepID=A0A1N7N5J7_9RHOB|nr:hypothetical protein [Roseivivax lentus]SIS93632.1 hypothetical protein SAMN05421759_1071 [Roseivivax lentus]